MLRGILPPWSLSSRICGGQWPRRLGPGDHGQAPRWLARLCPAGPASAHGPRYSAPRRPGPLRESLFFSYRQLTPLSEKGALVWSVISAHVFIKYTTPGGRRYYGDTIGHILCILYILYVIPWFHRLPFPPSGPRPSIELLKAKALL